MTRRRPKQIAFVLYPGLTPLDLIGPLQTLAPLPRIDPTFEVVVVAEHTDVVSTDAVVKLAPSHTFDDARSPLEWCAPCAGWERSRRCSPGSYHVPGVRPEVVANPPLPSPVTLWAAATLDTVGDGRPDRCIRALPRPASETRSGRVGHIPAVN